MALLASLGGVAAQAEAITDSAQRTVDVPANVSRVLPAGGPAQILMQALAPEKLIGLVEPFKPEHAVFVDPKLANLPQIPVLTRTDAPGDVAAVAALKPQLAVDYGSVNARFTAADEKIQQELKLPTVLFGGDLSGAAAVARALGKAMGVSQRADQVAALIANVLGRVKPLAEMPDADRVAVYLARGSDGLNAARAGTSLDEPIRLAGGRNVVTGSSGIFRRLSVDEVRALHPSVVVVSDRDALNGPLRAALPKDTKFVLDAGEPYKVLTGPPSLNRLAGVLALAAILHPDKIKVEAGEAKQIEATLFPIPLGLAEPEPLGLQP